MMTIPVGFIANAELAEHTSEFSNMSVYTGSVLIRDWHVELTMQSAICIPENIEAIENIVINIQKESKKYMRMFLESVTRNWEDQEFYCPDGLILSRAIVENAQLKMTHLNLFRYDESDRPHLQFDFSDETVFGDYPVLAYFMIDGEFIGAELATW